VALVGIVALVLASCGGGDSSTTPDTASDSSNITVAASGPPQYGGTVTFANEAEVDGFSPVVNRWPISGTMIANAVFDPLAAYDADGVARPYLAEAFTPNADFTAWTITLRPNVTFHNGEVLDGAAVKKFLDAVRASPLTGASLAGIATITLDPAAPLDVIVQMSAPWASFPATLAGQVGFVAAPAQLDAPAPDNTRVPIGTGPFVFSEWVPDRSFVATRNPNYWRTDADGNRLPYLDGVEFVPLPDVVSRQAALSTGDVDMLHTSSELTIAALRGEAEAGRIQLVLDTGDNDEAFVMFNTQVAPVDDVRVRRAAALCTDRDAYLAANDIPADTAAVSQYTADSPWFNPDAGFPTYDPAAGSALIAEVEAEKGPVEFTLGSTSPPEAQQQALGLKSQWEACGMTVNTSGTEFGKHVSDAVSGNYQAKVWRQFSAADPDGDYVWWIGRNAAPVGSFALNIARLQDDRIDAALDAARATPDRAVRERAYDELQVRQGELVPYVWLNHVRWGIAARDDVRAIGNQTLPDGSPSTPFQAGNFRLTQTWVQPG
jgi:ABC-type transport system substrate-binding protein